MIKLKQRIIISAAALLLLLAGCLQENFDDNRCGTGNEALIFSFSIDGMTTGSALRATVPPLEGETAVGTLHLLFFEAADDRNGALAGVVSVTGDGQANPGTAGKLTMETGYILPVTGDIRQSQAYHIVGIANLGAYVENPAEWLAQWNGVTESFFRNNAALEVEGTDNETDYTAHRPLKTNALLMNGSVDKPAGSKNIQMALTRNVARFDVQNDAATHTLQTVSVWNAFTLSSLTGDAPFDYASEALRTKRFYGIASAGNTVTGGLYSFANYSANPAGNDKNSTCLIIGLRNAGGAISYFRVNINADGTAQHIRENHVCNITILSVTGEGYPSENEAWEGTDNQLIYTVNNWDLDDNGLVVSDEFSILSLPLKTVKIDAQGGEHSYPISTYSTLADPAPLRIKNQVFDPADGNILPRISNGNLVIDAGPMNTGEEKRSGIITLTFAGLEVAVNVLQTAAGDTFLEVNLDDEWQECLPPTANAMSEYVYVKASGPWTAQISGAPHFAFRNAQGNYVTTLTSVECADNRFHIHTSTANESKTVHQKAFALISLDSDPVNYIAAIPLCQLPKGGFETNPEALALVEFDGNRKVKSPLPVSPGDTEYSFTVKSLSGAVNVNGIRLSGIHADKFEFAYRPDGSDPGKGTVTVKTKGLNGFFNPYTATLTINDNRNAILTVNLIQHPLPLKVTPPIDWVSVKGGVSEEIEVSSDDPEASWTATVTVYAKSGGFRQFIKNHPVKILKAGNNEALGVGEFTNQNLKVRFPKVYFPNRETDIEAIVTLTTSYGITASCSVYQHKLASKGVHIWSSYYTAYGTISYNASGVSDGAYFTTFNNHLKTNVLNTLGLSGGVSSVTNAPSLVEGTSVVGSNFTWVHISNHGLLASTNWTAVSNFINNSDGITVFMCDDYLADPYNAIMSESSPLKLAGYTLTMRGYNNQSSGSNTKLNTSASNTRIYKFIVTYGRETISVPEGSFTLFNDGVNTGAITVPEDAVPLLIYNNGSYAMVIDPKRKLVYHGDCTNFDTALNTTDARLQFMSNYQDYLAYAAMYGSHFIDLLIDYAPGDPAAVPEPWSEDWGVNAWPD